MKRVLIIISVILMLAGIGVILYPHIQQRLFVRSANNVINNFIERLEGYKAESEDGSLRWLYELAVAYNKELYENNQSNLIDPFSYEQVGFSLREIGGFEENIIGYINIPRMNQRLPIFLGATHANMRKGAVHLTETSLPVGGMNTNSVIAAHRGMSTAAMFRDIERLQIGDEITITNFYNTIRYEVVETMIIFPHQIDEVLIQSGRDLITLFSCHPYRQNWQRFVVFAERVH